MNGIKIKFEDHIKDHWSEKERNNAELLANFMQNLMNERNFDYIMKEYDNPHYTQHNRNIPDGIKGLVSYVKGIAKRFPGYGYSVKQILADGDQVVFHAHITFNKKDCKTIEKVS